MAKFLHQTLCPAGPLAALAALCLAATPLFAIPTMRFDEPEFETGAPIDGLELATLDGSAIPTVGFRFSLDGGPSTTATIGNGPGVSIWVNEPGMEGPTAGELAIEVAEPVTQVSLALALSSRNAESNAVRLVGLSEDGVLLQHAFDSLAPSGDFAGAFIAWQPPVPIRELRILFSTAAARFLVDDLRLETAGDPRPPPQHPPLVEEATTAQIEPMSAHTVVVWQRVPIERRTEIWAALLEDGTDVLSPPSLLTRIDGDPLTDLEITTAAAPDEVWVAWTSAELDTTHFAAIDPHGVSPVRTLRAAYSSNLRLLPLGERSPRWRAVWSEGGAILTQAYDIDGTPLGSQSLLHASPAEEVEQLEVVSLGRFGFAVASMTRQRTALRTHWFGLDASPRGAGYHRTMPSESQLVEMELEGSPSGRAILSWVQRHSDGRRQLRLQRFFPNGRNLAAELLVEGQRGPAEIDLAANSDGDFGVVWTSRAPSGTGTERALMAQMYAADGRAETTFPLEIASPSESYGSPRRPQLLLGNDDRGFVAFTRNDEGGASSGLFTTSSQHQLQGSDLCVTENTRLCLGGRFAVTAEFATAAGDASTARAVPWNEETGMFWFFDQSNIELVVKVLDGRAINDHYWVFYGALSNVAFTLHVEDTFTGEQRTYHNAQGTFASAGDVEALPALEGRDLRGAVQKPSSSRTGGALTRTADDSSGAAPWLVGEEEALQSAVSDDPRVLTLAEGRFELRARFLDGGAVGNGIAQSITSNSGAFWFFNRNNIELVVKVLDGTALNGHHWVYYGSLSNVAFELEVVDLATGESVIYTNQPGVFASRGDILALPSAGSGP